MIELDDKDWEKIEYVIKAVADEPISFCDSACAFCQSTAETDGKRDHSLMEDDPSHECVVTTAKRLIKEVFGETTRIILDGREVEVAGHTITAENLVRIANRNIASFYIMEKRVDLSLASEPYRIIKKSYTTNMVIDLRPGGRYVTVEFGAGDPDDHLFFVGIKSFEFTVKDQGNNNSHRCPRCDSVCNCWADTRALAGSDGCNHKCHKTPEQRREVL